MLIKSHEQLNQAVCETFFSSQLSKMGFTIYYVLLCRIILNSLSDFATVLLLISINNLKIAVLMFQTKTRYVVSVPG